MPLPPDPFVESVEDLLSSYEGVRSKRMFGGHGIYVNDFFVALIADGILYLKVDAETRATFAEAGMSPFVFTTKDGKESTMSYNQCPDEAFSRADTMKRWVDLAVGAAERQSRSKSCKKK